MVRSIAFAVPGDLGAPTGGYAYDRRMMAELERIGWDVDVINLGEGFPHPNLTTLAAARERLAAVAKGRTIVIDGLAFGVMPDAAALLRSRHPLIALVHHPLAMETGLSAAEADALRASEQAALAATRRVIVTSESTARLLAADYGVTPGRITVAPPGSDPVTLASGSSDGIVRLLAVGSIVPRKGFDVLIAALATLSDLPWQLTIAGDRGRDPAAAAQLDAAIQRCGLGERIAVLGAVPAERLAGLYATADMFVLASRFEGYGMAFAEAVAYGLPVVGTSIGAIPETVPSAAASLVAPDDVPALGLALREVIANPEQRCRLASAARAAAPLLPSWHDSAKVFSRALEAVA